MTGERLALRSSFCYAGYRYALRAGGCACAAADALRGLRGFDRIDVHRADARARTAEVALFEMGLRFCLQKFRRLPIGSERNIVRRGAVAGNLNEFGEIGELLDLLRDFLRKVFHLPLVCGIRTAEGQFIGKRMAADESTGGDRVESVRFQGIAQLRERVVEAAVAKGDDGKAQCTVSGDVFR